MILGVFGGVRGNLPALEAVLRALDDEGIERIACTGDLVTGYPWAKEVAGLLRRRDIPCVQGQHDRQVVRFLRKDAALRRRLERETVAALRRAYESLDSGHLEYLRGLPKSMVLTIDGIDVMLCHGTPGNPAESLGADDEDRRFERQREVTPAPIVIHGATDLPHVRHVSGTLFVNPGALGDDTALSGHACYAVVSTEDEPWEAEIRYAAYDADAAHEARETALRKTIN